MSRIIKTNFELRDERGTLREIARGGPWAQMNEYERKKGSVVGNHYHKVLSEFFYVVSGSMKVVLYNINTKERAEFIAKKGDAFEVHRFEVHAMQFIEDSTFVTLLDHTFDSSNPDIYKYELVSLG
jgi:quercetin dioxygenase-like cupin family protein